MKMECKLYGDPASRAHSVEIICYAEVQAHKNKIRGIKWFKYVLKISASFIL